MMAAVDVILLSSPHRLSSRHIAPLSSSPSFPSPASLLLKRPQLRTENRFAPVPLSATNRFANAPSQQRKTVDEKGQSFGESATSVTNEISIWDIPSDAVVKPKTTRKPRISKGAVDQDDVLPKKIRKPRVKKATAETEEGKPLNEKPAPKGRTKKAAKNADEVVTTEKLPSKPRSSKAAAEGQTKLPKGKVTKPAKTILGEKVLQKKVIETVSRHFSSVVKDLEDPLGSDSRFNDDLQLQEAVKRRMDWTPPPPETHEIGKLTKSALEDVFEIMGPDVSTAKQAGITDLLGSFNHKEEIPRDISSQSVAPVGLKKRKLIELVKTNMSPQPNAAVKVAAAKKKPRTITEKATAAYAANDGQKADSTTTRLRHFSHPALTPEGAEEVENLQALPKTRFKSPAKTSAKTRLSNKAMVMTEALLSPQSALRRVEDQQFVFGTSSQLAKESCPSQLRDLHGAMRASNQIEIDPYEQTVDNVVNNKSSTTQERGTGSYQATRNLWAAASNRINDGQKDVEMVDLSESPLLTKPSKPTETQQPRASEPTIPKEVDDGKWLNLDEGFEFIAAAKAKISNIVSVPMGPQSRPSSSSQGDLGISDGRRKELNPSNQGLTIQRPNYAGYTTAQLSKEIASYRFKPLKGREKMIALLERCWEGKQKAVGCALRETEKFSVASAQSSQTAANAEASFPAGSLEITRAASGGEKKPSSSRSRVSRAKSKEPPSKLSATALALRITPKKKCKITSLVEEISDSDTPLTPSPPRRHQCQISSPPPPLTLNAPPIISISKQRSQNESNAMTADISEKVQSDQDNLHKAISMAITSAPRSIDPQTPSWHEKILLYDPIVLEDLAGWLNNGELARVGWKGGFHGVEAVSAAEVKAWCLSKSICCLWKENLRGGARSRY